METLPESLRARAISPLYDCPVRFTRLDTTYKRPGNDMCIVRKHKSNGNNPLPTIFNPAIDEVEEKTKGIRIELHGVSRR